MAFQKGNNNFLPLLFIFRVIHKQRCQQEDDAQDHQSQALQLAGHFPAHKGQHQAQHKEQGDEEYTQFFLIFKHTVTLSFQAANGHALGQVLLDAAVQDQRGQHDQHQARVHGAVIRGGLLGLHQIQQTNGQGLAAVQRSHQGHGNDVLVPEGQEVEQDDRDDRGLCHGENDLQHGAEITGTIDIGRFFIVMGQGGKIAGQQVDGKGQRSSGVDHSQHEQVVQQEALAEDLFQPNIAVAEHQEDGDHDIVNVNEQACHEGGVQELLAEELEPGQTVSGRQCHHQQQGQRSCGDNDGVEHILAHLRRLPGFHEILPIEALGQVPGVGIEFGVLLDGCHEHPCHGNDDEHCQKAQYQVDKGLIKALTGEFDFLLFHSHTSLEFQSFPLSDLVHQGGQGEGEQEDHNADGHAVAIQAVVLLAVHIAQHHFTGAVGTTGGHGLNEQERHVNGRDDEEGQRGADVGPDQGNGDLEELGDPVSTIQGGAFIQGAGNRGHGSHVHDHVVADGLPDHGDNDAHHDHFLALPEDALLQIHKGFDDGVQHTVLRLINSGEDTGNNNNGQNIGDVEHHPEETLTLDLFFRQDICENQCQRHGDDCDHHDQQQGILHGTDKGGVLQQRRKIAQTHKGLLRGESAPLIKRHTENVDRRHDHEDDEQNHCRSNAGN